MPETSHVRASLTAPATTLEVSLEYSYAVDIFEILAGDGVVEADAEFAAILCPDDAIPGTLRMAHATPAYLQDLAQRLKAILNDVSTNDVCTFIEAMLEAQGPNEMGDVAWAEVWSVYENVSGSRTQPQSSTWTCILVDVYAPGYDG